MLGIHRKITELENSHSLSSQQNLAISHVIYGIIMAISYQILYTDSPTAQIPGSHG